MGDAPVLSKPPTGNPLVEAWLVLVIAVASGLGLAAVQLGLTPRIEANKEAETKGQVPALLSTQPATVSDERIAGRRVLRAADAQGATIGWVIPASGPGFADRIELLIAVDGACSTLQGLFILNQKETPGLGDFITGTDWRGQWKGKSAAGPLTVVKGASDSPDRIRAITGATISSESVAEIVNRALGELRGPLAAATAKGIDHGK